MGKHKKSKKDSRSSSSSSSSDDKRRKRRKRAQKEKDLKIGTLEELVRQLRQENARAASSSQQSTTSPRRENRQDHVRYVGRNDALPEFDPQTTTIPVDQWIRTVESIATLYGWDEKTTICNCTSKLRGYAKRWYERLEIFDASWLEWKTRLVKAFPFARNRLAMLRTLVSTTRRPEEDPIQFYYEKLGLGMSCGLSDDIIAEAIVGTIGDKIIEVGAISAGCKSTAELLKYLAGIPQRHSDLHLRKHKDNVVRTMDMSKCFTCGRTGHKARACRFKKSMHSTDSKTTEERRCHDCQEVGHIAKNCPRKGSAVKKCTFCKLLGHTVDVCRKKKYSESTVKNVLTLCISETDAKYYKTVKVNGKECTAYVDFGSACNTIKKSVQERLSLKLDEVEKNFMIKGFGGALTSPLGRASVQLSIDGVVRDTSVLVVPDKLLNVDILVGQPFTEATNIMVVKSATNLHIMDDYGVNLESIFGVTKKIALNSVDGVALTPGINRIEVYTDEPICAMLDVHESEYQKPGCEAIVLSNTTEMTVGTAVITVYCGN